MILMSHLSVRQLQSSYRTQRWNIFFMNWHFRVIIPPISPRQAQWQFMKTLSCSHWCCTQHSLFFFLCGQETTDLLEKVRKMWGYSSLQCFFFLGLGCGHKTARIASSKTFLRPFCVRAEHSRYLTAPISLAMASPWG